MADTVRRPTILSLLCVFYVLFGVGFALLSIALIAVINDEKYAYAIVRLVFATIIGVLFVVAAILGWRGKKYSWFLMFGMPALVLLMGAINSGYDSADFSLVFPFIFSTLYLLCSRKSQMYMGLIRAR